MTLAGRSLVVLVLWVSLLYLFFSPTTDSPIPNVSASGRPTGIYDGPTHVKYLSVSRAWENWYCYIRPGRDLQICNTFLPSWFDADLHSYSTEVKPHPQKGRSLMATEDIPKGSFVLPHDASLSLRVEQDKWEAPNKCVDDFPDAEMFRQLRDFFLAYGFESEVLRISGWSVSIACNNSFTNHACTDEEVTVETLDCVEMSAEGKHFSNFSPPLARRADVEAGEEIQMDYRHFRDDMHDPEFNEFLNKMCSDTNMAWSASN